ncbi:DUF982 domain-containing protein [Rhizobium mongolense]|uniref:DUF982 domain-containing protein n=1 Tax=Rhizobium gallicum TaxID=56730 RepID=UPI003556D6CC
MFQTAWSKPVFVRLLATTHPIRTPSDARTFLVDIWPFSPGEAYERALDASQSCFQGHTTAEEVRIAFIAACREANILVGI